MSVPLYSCTREARFVSVPTPHILEARFVSVSTPPYVGSAFRLRFNASIYNMTNKKRNENFFISNLSPHSGRAGSSCSNYRLLRG